MREEGYDLVFDYNDEERGLQTVLPSGAVVTSDGLYSLGTRSSLGLINPHSEYEAGQTDHKTYMRRLEERKRFARATEGITNSAGDCRFRCPVKAPGSARGCPLMARGDEKPTAKQRLELTVTDMSGFSAAPPAICRLASMTVKNSVEDGTRGSGKDLPTPPRSGRTCTVSAAGLSYVTTSLKNSRGIGIGDSTVRLMRGWAGQQSTRKKGPRRDLNVSWRFFGTNRGFRCCCSRSRPRCCADYSF